MNQRCLLGLLIAGSLLIGSGCRQEPIGAFVPSKRVAKLSEKFQGEITQVLTTKTGKAGEPKLLGQLDLPKGYLKHGFEVYSRNCLPCHGFTGDGNGPAATYLLPKPRDYRPGIFKFTSTSYGAKPLREDLLRTIRRGIAGTSMPAFPLLPPKDAEAVVDYVISLSMRGELEGLLADSAEFNGSIDQAEVPQMTEKLVSLWAEGKSKVVYPVAPMPVFSNKDIEEGQSAFLSQGCSKCHGNDGRGQTADNIGVDAWGNPTKAADLTSGMLRGGTEPLDIYRHIDAGINGTPMPSFRKSFEKNPETMWKLVAYVLYMSNDRRKGVIPDAGMLKPLPGVGADTKPAATTLNDPASSKTTPRIVGAASE
jgi:mono/diheme cytochrome c family protein